MLILQNIAACYPLLSGHLSFQPFDPAWGYILAVHCSSSLFRKSIHPGKQSSHGHWSAGPASCVAHLSVRACSWLHVWVEKRGERRGGYPCIFAKWSGVKLSFYISFRSGDCGEDGRGDLPFAAGYGVRRSWLSPSLAMERGAGTALAANHSRPLFFPVLFLPCPEP
jgi:hypothetical protein